MRGTRLVALGRLASVLLLLGLSGCLDLGILSSGLFARAVPGLRPDQPWVSLPVGVWLVEAAVEPQALSACFAPSCDPQAAVAVFAARGREAEELGRVIADPAGLSRLLAEPRGALRHGRSRPRTHVTAEARREGALSGFAVRLAGEDGRRSAAGYVLAARRPGSISIVLVIAHTEEAARRIALDVAPHLG